MPHVVQKSKQTVEVMLIQSIEHLAVVLVETFQR